MQVKYFKEFEKWLFIEYKHLCLIYSSKRLIQDNAHIMEISSLIKMFYSMRTVPKHFKFWAVCIFGRQQDVNNWHGMINFPKGILLFLMGYFMNMYHICTLHHIQYLKNIFCFTWTSYDMHNNNCNNLSKKINLKFYYMKQAACIRKIILKIKKCAIL